MIIHQTFIYFSNYKINLNYFIAKKQRNMLNNLNILESIIEIHYSAKIELINNQYKFEKYLNKGDLFIYYLNLSNVREYFSQCLKIKNFQKMIY
jgi:hypothetical protein